MTQEDFLIKLKVELFEKIPSDIRWIWRNCILEFYEGLGLSDRWVFYLEIQGWLRDYVVHNRYGIKVDKDHASDERFVKYLVKSIIELLERWESKLEG